MFTLGLINTSYAQFVVSANDNKVKLENGVLSILPNAVPDTVSIIDLNSKTPTLVSEIDVPSSVIGPPGSVAVRWDERYAIVTSATKVDPENPAKTVPNNQVTLLDLGVTPPAVLSKAEAGAGASGVAIAPSGNLAVVANRNEGTVSVFALKGKELVKINTVTVGDEKSATTGAVFTPDGKYILVTRDGDSAISLLTVKGEKVEYNKRDISAGLRPYQIAIHPSGKFAVVGHVGRSTGDIDTISVIDLTTFTTSATYDVGRTPEGVSISPDGKYVAVTLQNGSNKGRDFMFYSNHGKLAVFSIQGMKLTKFAETDIGGWPQGSVFSNDSKTILVQSGMEKEIQVFRIDQKNKTKIKDTGQRIKVKGVPSGIGAAARY
jgi:DNA-binding beta-propeller fold protein YncE